MTLKQLVHRISSVDVVKVFSLNAIATFVRMLAGMISVKVVAVIIGPSGIALLGQLNNLITILLGVANGGINSGITKYVAEYKDDDSYIHKLLSNAFRIIVVCTLIVSIIMIFGSYHLSKLIMRDGSYFYVFIVFGITLIFYTLNGMLISVLNGYKKFQKYIKVNIGGTILGVIYSILLVTTFGLPGALINAVTFQSVVFFVTLYMCRHEIWLKKEYFIGRYDRNIVKKYFGYSAMTLTSLALFPLSQLFLRGYVISEISVVDAGIWEGMNRISHMYLGVITSAFTIYYLPRLSEISNNQELRQEIFRCYKFFVPMLLLIGVTIYLLRYVILWLLFTPAFTPMEQLFPWQLAADFLKICSLLISLIMLAKAKTKMYIITEIVFTISYFSLSFLFMRMNGVVGLVQGYMSNILIYFITMVFLFRKTLIPSKNDNSTTYSTSKVR